MQESQSDFSCSWADLRPIRGLVVTLLVMQIVGAIAGLLLLGHNMWWFLRLWFGGAVVTFPAFLVGLVIQGRLRPGSINENRVMVRRLGVISLLLTIAALLIAKLGGGS